MAEDQVGLVGEVGQVGQVALLARDPVGDAGLAGAPVEGGEGVGAGVDDLDGVAQLGQRDGEPAGATADVDDAGLPPVGRVAGLEEAAYALPDHAGADGLAALAGRGARGRLGHGRNPSGSACGVRLRPHAQNGRRVGAVAPFIRGSRDCGATGCGTELVPDPGSAPGAAPSLRPTSRAGSPAGAMSA